MMGVMRDGPVAVLVVVIFLVAALTGAGVLNPAATFVADAQSEPVTTVNGIVLPPQVPGLDYTSLDEADAGAIDGLLVPATPTVPLTSDDAPADPAAPESDGASTTSLGGQDVTVSSVGGSYEVDSPKKRSNRRK
jgi:hypothetical protein